MKHVLNVIQGLHHLKFIVVRLRIVKLNVENMNLKVIKKFDCSFFKIFLESTTKVGNLRSNSSKDEERYRLY